MESSSRIEPKLTKRIPGGRLVATLDKSLKFVVAFEPSDETRFDDQIEAIIRVSQRMLNSIADIAARSFRFGPSDGNKFDGILHAAASAGEWTIERPEPIDVGEVVW